MKYKPLRSTTADTHMSSPKFKWIPSDAHGDVVAFRKRIQQARAATPVTRVVRVEKK